jgi:uncharacterized membrane protein YcaP (DUF421 family)
MDFHSYLNIILSTSAVYLFIIIAIRLFGKKEISQLSVVDLIFILLISNAVQNAMVGSDTSLAGGLLAAATLFLMNYLFKQLIYRFPKLGRVLQGEPVLLIYKGKLNKANIAKSRLTLDELQEAVREHGVALFEDVDLAMLEADGNISIVSGDFQHKTIKKRKGTKKESNS